MNDSDQALLNISTPATGILHLSLNRPAQLNALSEALLTQLLACFHHAKEDRAVKAILLTGEGKGFCAGADIRQLASLSGPQGLAFARFGQQVCRALETLGKPSLAAIQGFALGGGCELAMAATLRLAAEGALFGQPEVRLGVLPGFGGTQRLSRLVGKGRALEICLTGRRFTAGEALQWGFLSEITKEADLLPRAIALLKTLVDLPPFALASLITVINTGYDLPLEEALELEATHFGLCCTTADKSEGVNAFLEKRSAEFSGS